LDQAGGMARLMLLFNYAEKYAKNVCRSRLSLKILFFASPQVVIDKSRLKFYSKWPDHCFFLSEQWIKYLCRQTTYRWLKV